MNGIIVLQVNILMKVFPIILLKDGLLSISYKSNGGELFVTDIYFSDEFIYLPQYLGYNYPKYYGILPQDYPPEA